MPLFKEFIQVLPVKFSRWDDPECLVFSTFARLRTRYIPWHFLASLSCYWITEMLYFPHAGNVMLPLRVIHCSHEVLRFCNVRVLETWVIIFMQHLLLTAEEVIFYTFVSICSCNRSYSLKTNKIFLRGFIMGYNE